ncbi:hypothetical protein IMAU30132_00075 [Lactobacillus helveticus]|uniref:conserved phage C-terminal domain-containing protein n=1 Tax=Lactobacillus helveticus TaxID=1587 RepID=UPI0015620347|nr:conserved phage C-terminal domain-containing protein [Lactobacillus helveticus]NRO47725.1 hypothetical protein [Lactobacillus helveticus]
MGKEFTGSKAFLNIPVGIARDEDLLKKPKTILLMGEIVSMLNVTGEFFMGNKKIAQRLRVSTRTVNDYLDILEKKKLIEREKVISKENDAIIGRKISAGADLVKYISLGWCDELHRGSEVDFTTLVKPTSHKKNSIKEQYKRTTNKYSPADAEHHIPYEEIVDYLNLKTDASYKSTAKPTQRLIKARWHEGYRLDDFKKVVDNKAFEWQGDSKMWKYMRPTTLFGSKFDDYLNANNLDKSRKKPTTGGYEELLNGVNIQDIPDDELPF